MMTPELSKLPIEYRADVLYTLYCTMYCIMYCIVELAELLIEYGADVNQTDRVGDNSLMSALNTGKSKPEMIKLFIQQGTGSYNYNLLPNVSCMILVDRPHLTGKETTFDIICECINMMYK